MLAHGTLLFAASVVGLVQAGNTTCKTTSLDWYTQSVGETPCRTYERLQQICTPNYQVGNFGPTAPGDKCSTSFRGCCCNAVAWSLSMLCMNCQYGTGTGAPGDPGIDAPVGGYGEYLNNCGTATNRSLPDRVQAAVCQQNIKIPALLYGGTWDVGSWYYGYIKGQANLDISSGKNESSPRPSCPTPSSTSTGAMTPTVQSTSSESRIPVGAIIGGAVGGVVLLSAAILLGCFITRKRKDRGVVDLTEENKSSSQIFEPYSSTLGPTDTDRPAEITPYTGRPGSSDWTNAPEPSQSTQASIHRHNKPGLIASNPPTGAELRPLTSIDGRSSPDLSEQHEDSGALTDAFGLGRSASGRLPPSYQARN